MFPFPRLVFSTTLAVLSFWLASPLFALTLEARGYSASFIGWFVAMPSAMLLLTMAGLSKLTTRLGADRAYRWGVGLVTLAAGVLYCIDNVWVWLAASALMGVGNGLYWVASEAWVASLVANEKRGRTIGMVETFIGVSMAASAFLLAAIQANFALGIAFILGSNLLALLLIYGLRAPFVQESAQQLHAVSYWRVWRHCPLIVSAAFLGGFSEGLAAPMFPLLGIARGLSVSQAALLITMIGIANIVSQYPLGYVSDRWHESRVFHGCMALAVLGAAAMATLPAAWMGVGVAVWALGVGGGYTLAIVVAGRYFSGAAQITAMALALVSYSLGGIVGPIVGGAALDHWGVLGIPAVLVVVALGVGPFTRAPKLVVHPN